ncbi:bifunctional 3,4-dihydroxy-2-butanone-4-phosphate synthase/GTP cyclohydrolase II [Chloroflexus sp.]|uniref:bifunctional 3,4-dihydroxy-2-butanone-4-phosphate synthase/GTP cyclohydrolase II n=1 Tax=Chloroflexus sp. TaxID=1904827 RepID=UPI00298F06FB|nr:bifunctional 3,4-dihydroxy-2-butanone-4-phosphate synthase/GTP cyclohydrolase II [Chloroflexus sp.]MDW8404266.1 bifunctional 3,4-dihydroxy-2-butanone-4-phosphate synthase/GTP cyclohydrolase II [Chloroflexus sp.]
MPFASVADAIADFRAGKFVIIVDAEDRENEGDLAIAAEFASPQAINFMAREGRGLICVAMTGERLDELRLPLMVPPTENTTRFGTAFTVSVEARRGVTTGISAFDRATTIRTLIDPATRPEDLARPGHVFPLRAAVGGVLARPGQTEASLDLARLAGLYPAAVICEIMNPDGTMARLPELTTFAAQHGLKILPITELIAYRYRTEVIVRRVAETMLPTARGTFRLIAFENTITAETHLALTLGQANGQAPLVRLHSECLTGDAFGSQRCDCGAQLAVAQQRIAEAGYGALLYLRQEGRGIGLINKLRAYALQDQGLDTVEANYHLGLPADARDYGIAAQILRDLGMEEVRLLTNNPAKVAGLERYGIVVRERLPLHIPPTAANRRYLATKRMKLGHLIPEHL